MEGFKGTPGRWVNVGGWVDSDKPGDLSSIICAIDSVTPRNPEAVNNANANLIAAAPDLLEALIEARVWVHGWNATNESEESYKALVMCNKAIDRALGQ